MKQTTSLTWIVRLLPFFLVTLSPCHLVSLSSSATEPSPSRPDLAYAERALRKAGAEVDGAGLLAFIRARTLSADQHKELANKVRALGSAEYTEREKASRELVALGRPALPYLRPAVNDPDLETSRRARRCIEKIQRSAHPSLLTLAALLVKERRPAGAVPVFLNYLPSIEDELLEETWLDALRAVGWNEGRADPALLAALADKRLLFRAAAAHVLARGGDAGVRERVAPLLADAKARIRFEAAAGLARFGNKKAVVVLLALLDDGPFTLACRSEHLLRLLAGGQGPQESLDRDEPAVRRECRGAWEAWWKKQGEHVDLARLKPEEPPHGLTVLCEDGEEGSRVWECGPGGQPCWEVLHLEGAFAAQLLPGGRVLVAEHHANRVTERDAEGKILWEHRTAVNPIACQRQANGNTLIATYQALYEVTREHKEVLRHTDRRDFRDALRLPNGHILYVTGDGVLVERDAACEHLTRTIQPEEHAEGAKYRARVEPLLNGRFLLTLGGSNRVVEIDGSGKIRWEHRVHTPMSATRLRNGHTLIACFEDRCVIEVDRAGKEINKQPLSGHPYAVMRY
ncbi:MAG TPA: HEAT repeat domain-containing protein [Gemmataceae bacterium]|nr:HEAT repeat domain-containing protein [Gemmataceae bacterium]